MVSHQDNDILIYCPALMWSTIFVLIQDAVTICTLGTGTAFGESILDNTPRHATIVTREFSELLRIEQREFRSLWEVSASVCSICICISLQKVSGCTELCDTSLSLTQGTSEKAARENMTKQVFLPFLFGLTLFPLSQRSKIQDTMHSSSNEKCQGCI